MNNKKKLTTYEILDQIANIADKDERKEALRNALKGNKPLAIIIQYTYHPDVVFDLPEGPLPESIAKKSGHDQYGILLRATRKLYQFRKETNLKRQRKEQNFTDLYESVASDDAEILIAVKDKKLPWKTLNKSFVCRALPELFPEMPKPGRKKKTEAEKA